MRSAYKTYKRRHFSILARIRAWFNLGVRWVKQNPRYTRKDPPPIDKIFDLNRG